MARFFLASLLCLALAACDGAAPQSQPANGKPVTDLKAGAPKQPEAFIEWADEQLRKRVPAVKAPDPRPAADPHWTAIDLIDYFDEELVESRYRSSPPENAALVSLGPFSTDRPLGKFAVHRVTSRRGVNNFELVVRFDPVQRESIGRIKLSIRVPEGNFLEIRWSDAGKLRVPIANNEGLLPLSISTAGFGEWTGRMNEIALRCEASETPVTIERFELFGHADSFPQAAAVSRIKLAGEMRSAIYAHAPSVITLPDVLVPEDGRLQIGLGLRAPDKGLPTNPILRVKVRGGGREATVIEETVRPLNSWLDFSASLKEWAGQPVTILLDSSDASEGYVAMWGNPTLYTPVEDPPLVILYLIDTLAAKHIDLYGYELETMPNVRKWAQDGAWFQNAYCNSPVTVSSVKDLLLSMPAARHGVYSYSLNAPRELIPIPEAIRESGVATVLMSTNVNAGPAQQTDRGFDTFIDRIAFTWTDVQDRTIPIPEVMHWIRQHRDRAAFVYIHTAEPHAPYAAPPEFRKAFKGTNRNKAEWANYDAEVAYADHRFGKFLDALKKADLFDRAHIILTSDHGEELYEHGHLGHGKGLYDEVMRIPMVAVGPRFSRRGAIMRPTQMFDIGPTLLDLFDVQPPYPLTGESLLPMLTSETEGASEQRTIIGGFDELRGQGLREWFIVRDATWKLVFFRKGSAKQRPRLADFELYNLKNDPGETSNLLRNEPAIFRELVFELLDFMTNNPPYKNRSEPGSMQFDLQQIEQLRDLGYVE